MLRCCLSKEGSHAQSTIPAHSKTWSAAGRWSVVVLGLPVASQRHDHVCYVASGLGAERRWDQSRHLHYSTRTRKRLLSFDDNLDFGVRFPAVLGHHAPAGSHACHRRWSACPAAACCAADLAATRGAQPPLTCAVFRFFFPSRFCTGAPSKLVLHKSSSVTVAACAPCSSLGPLYPLPTDPCTPAAQLQRGVGMHVRKRMNACMQKGWQAGYPER